MSGVEKIYLFEVSNKIILYYFVKNQLKNLYILDFPKSQHVSKNTPRKKYEKSDRAEFFPVCPFPFV